ncbi:MAG: LamG domain-containing protein [Phycisphaerae bacterium]|nr:LamG domain-containing protein [Phycisphaerae bacterium]
MKMKVLFLVLLLGISCQVFGGDPNTPSMIQHYTFDGNLNDSESSNDGTAVNDGPEFVDGVVGQAAKFYGNRYVDLGPNAYPSIANGGAMDNGTICFWFNSVSTTTDTLIGTASQNSSLMLNILFVSQRLRFAIRDEDGTMRQVEIDIARDGQWHHIAFAYTTGPETEFEIYLNGEPQKQYVLAGNNPETFSAWEFPIYVGMLNNRGAEANAYTGMLDDLRVYNYSLDAIEIATIYTEVRTDESICAMPPEYDFDGDCEVTVVDLAMLASEWLNCGIVPICIQ